MRKPRRLADKENMEKFDLSLILACYNEENLIQESVEQIVEVLDHTNFTYELIFVDDMSSDNTRELIVEIANHYQDVATRYLFHENNVGRGRTVTDGFRLARGEIAGYIDIDLEVHARYIPSCVLAIRNGVDVATAYRVYKFKWRSLDRYLLSKGYSWLISKLLKLPLQDTETGYKFFNLAKLEPVLAEVEDHGWFWDTEFLARAHVKNLEIREIPCLFLRRFDKTSSVNVINDTVDYMVKLVKFRSKLAHLRSVDYGSK